MALDILHVYVHAVTDSDVLRPFLNMVVHRTSSPRYVLSRTIFLERFSSLSPTSTLYGFFIERIFSFFGVFLAICALRDRLYGAFLFKCFTAFRCDQLHWSAFLGQFRGGNNVSPFDPVLIALVTYKSSWGRSGIVRSQISSIFGLQRLRLCTIKVQKTPTRLGRFDTNYFQTQLPRLLSCLFFNTCTDLLS